MPYLPTGVKARLDSSTKQLADYIRQRDQLNVLIIQLQNEVRALSTIVWRDELTQRQNDLEQIVIGISDAVRSILRLQRKAMTAGQVKDALDLMGYDFKDLANPSALVHNTLKRMHGTGELQFDPDTKTFRFGPWDVNDPSNPMYRSGMRPPPEQPMNKLKARMRDRNRGR